MQEAGHRPNKDNEEREQIEELYDKRYVGNRAGDKACHAAEKLIYGLKITLDHLWFY